MKKSMSYIFGLLLTVFAFSANSYEEGTEYVSLASPQPVTSEDKIEVIEFFWYGCPHCYHLEPGLKDWLAKKPEDVEFIRIPAVFGPSWELLARAYYTAEILNVLDKTHTAIFDQIHKARKPIRKVGDVKAFFVGQGVSEADFTNTYNSFAVVTKTNRAKQAQQRYGLDSVPTLVVAGKHRTGPSMSGGNAAMLKVVDSLIDLERKADKPERAASKAQ